MAELLASDRYSPLPDFIQRIRFLRVVQLPLLDQYHGRILSSLDAFEAFSSAFIKAVPGAFGVTVGGREEAVVHLDSQGLTSGVSGVQRLGKALLSAKYIEVSLHKWGDELVSFSSTLLASLALAIIQFFVELWTAVNQNPNVPDHTTPTQPALSQGPESDKEDLSCGTFFDALISHYEKLVNRAEDMIVHQVCGEVERALKVHFAADISYVCPCIQTTDFTIDFLFKLGRKLGADQRYRTASITLWACRPPFFAPDIPGHHPFVRDPYTTLSTDCVPVSGISLSTTNYAPP